MSRYLDRNKNTDFTLICSYYIEIRHIKFGSKTVFGLFYYLYFVSFRRKDKSFIVIFMYET